MLHPKPEQIGQSRAKCMSVCLHGLSKRLNAPFPWHFGHLSAVPSITQLPLHSLHASCLCISVAVHGFEKRLKYPFPTQFGHSFLKVIFELCGFFFAFVFMRYGSCEGGMSVEALTKNRRNVKSKVQTPHRSSADASLGSPWVIEPPESTSLLSDTTTMTR